MRVKLPKVKISRLFITAVMDFFGFLAICFLSDYAGFFNHVAGLVVVFAATLIMIFSTYWIAGQIVRDE